MFFFRQIIIEGAVPAQMDGYYAIDDIDVRDSYCGLSPNSAGQDVLSTPPTVSRPTTAFQSLFK
jgi:hypothetical protein